MRHIGVVLAVAISLIVLPSIVLLTKHRIVSDVLSAKAAQSSMPAMTLRYTEYLDCETKPCPDGRGRRISQIRMLAYRPDGSTSDLQEFRVNGTERTIGERNLTLVQENKRVHIKVEAGVKTTLIIGKDNMDRLLLHRLDPVSDCLKTHLGDSANGSAVAGRSAIMGISVVQVSVPGSRIVYSYAPSLGCVELGRTARFSVKAPTGEIITTVSELILDSIQFGEPDPSVFTIPASYDEVDPLDARVRWERTWGRAVSKDAFLPNVAWSQRLEEYERYKPR